MLKKLTVKSFAIIEDLTITFDDKMTVLTGQTGAGKSLIIDTISLLLGSRADSDMIRHNDEKASIIGEFIYKNDSINQILNNLNIPLNESLIIKREITLAGKNTIKINDVLVNLNTLKQIAVYLADIHVQHDTYMLINPETYLNFIDPVNDKTFDKVSNNYIIKLSKYHKSKQTYDKILNNKKNTEEKLEYLQFVFHELSNLKLKPDEDKLIEEKVNILNNYDRIYNNLLEAYNYLDNEYFSVDNISKAASLINKISSYDKDYNNYYEKLIDSFYIIDEVKNDIKGKIDNLDFDSDELNKLNERLNDINNIKKKYKLDVNELIEHLKNISLDISMITNYEDVLKENYLEVVNSYNSLVESSKEVSNHRKKLAKIIEQNIIGECKSLDLENTQFEISFNEVKYGNPLDQTLFKQSGVDEIDFLISLNLGEPKKSLHKTASGGEMSRIMLAFKTYFSKRSNLSLMVFDEIDSGISGQTASKIALKLKEISRNTQVLCITHLPQVAAIGDNHLYIFKEEIDNRTKTNISKLNFEERAQHIAIMIAGNKITKHSLEHAKELLMNQ